MQVTLTLSLTPQQLQELSGFMALMIPAPAPAEDVVAEPEKRPVGRPRKQKPEPEPEVVELDPRDEAIARQDAEEDTQTIEVEETPAPQPEVEAVPAPTPVQEAPALTFDDVRTRFMSYSKNKNRDHILEILEKVGASTLTQTATMPESWPLIMAAIAEEEAA
jgi:hypothetical protein